MCKFTVKLGAGIKSTLMTTIWQDLWMWCGDWFRTVGVQHCAVPVKATNRPSVIHWEPIPLIWWNWTGDPGQNTVWREDGERSWTAILCMWTASVGSAATFVGLFVCLFVCLFVFYELHMYWHVQNTVAVQDCVSSQMILHSCAPPSPPPLKIKYQYDYWWVRMTTQGFS